MVYLNIGKPLNTHMNPITCLYILYRRFLIATMVKKLPCALNCEQRKDEVKIECGVFRIGG